MIDVEAEVAEGRLRIDFSKHVSAVEAAACLPKIRQAVAELPAGFKVLVDLTDLETMDLACAEPLKQTMDLCRRAGASKVVRIIPHPEKDIGLNIMSQFHYPRNMAIVTCQTRAEAIQALAE